MDTLRDRLCAPGQHQHAVAGTRRDVDGTRAVAALTLLERCVLLSDSDVTRM